MSLEMAQKVIVPQKKIMSRSFLNSGTLIVICVRTKYFVYPAVGSQISGYTPGRGCDRSLATLLAEIETDLCLHPWSWLRQIFAYTVTYPRSWWAKSLATPLAVVATALWLRPWPRLTTGSRKRRQHSSLWPHSPLLSLPYLARDVGNTWMMSRM
jgi:hypothetical protein